MERKYYWKPKVDFGTSPSTPNISGLLKYCPQTLSWYSYSQTLTPLCQQLNEEKMEPNDPTESGLQQTTSDGLVKTPSQTTGLTRLRERPLMINKYLDCEFKGETALPTPLNADDYDSVEAFTDALNAKARGETELFDMNEKARLKVLREQGIDEEQDLDSEDDPVNCPDHYTVGSIETIDYITDVLGEYHAAMFCHGNVLKYTGTRLFNKGKPIQDAKKAVWYLNKMIELLEFTEDTHW
jgi:hypothetical protein